MTGLDDDETNDWTLERTNLVSVSLLDKIVISLPNITDKNHKYREYLKIFISISML